LFRNGIFVKIATTKPIILFVSDLYFSIYYTKSHDKHIIISTGATLSLSMTNGSSISLVEGATLLLCVALDRDQISLLRRTVVVAISSSQSSIEDQGMVVVSACSIDQRS
jgi:hypothetical protein